MARVLIATTRFHPSIGGVQTVSRVLAEALAGVGNEVRVVTLEKVAPGEGLPFSVFRRPSPMALVRLFHWAGAVVLNGDTLRLGWPLLLGKHNVVCVHHIAPRKLEPAWSPGIRLRRRLVRRCRNSSPGAALALEVAHQFGVICGVLRNPYDSRLFRPETTTRRGRDLAFVGRLVPEKGADLVLEAVHYAAKDGWQLRTTIAGEGPALSELTAQSRRLGVEGLVDFVGPRSGTELAHMLRSHTLLVIPSRYPETFPTVALEAIACGCVVLGADTGNTSEAIGECGTTFAGNNAHALTTAVKDLLSRPELLARYRQAAGKHLAPHQPEAVARRYMELLSVGEGD